jgi:hypothetical protein
VPRKPPSPSLAQLGRDARRKGNDGATARSRNADKPRAGLTLVFMAPDLEDFRRIPASREAVTARMFVDSYPSRARVLLRECGGCQ